MTGNNQFVPFGTGAGANILTAPAWAALAARQSGFVDGIADVAQCNTAWRQASVVAAVLGQFIADAGYDALDNGDLDALETNLRLAIAGAAAGIVPETALVHFGRDTSTIAGTLTAATITPPISSLAEGMLFEIVPNTDATGGCVLSVGGQAYRNLLRRDGAALKSGDVKAGVPLLCLSLGGVFRVLGVVASEIAAVSSTTINNLSIVGQRLLASYTATRTYSWICPEGVTKALIEGQGAGAGGGAGNGYAGAGGTGGNWFRAIFDVIPGSVYQIVIGAGGAGGGGGAQGANGGLTSFGPQGGATMRAVSGGAGGGAGGNSATNNVGVAASPPPVNATAFPYGGIERGGYAAQNGILLPTSPTSAVGGQGGGSFLASGTTQPYGNGAFPGTGAGGGGSGGAGSSNGGAGADGFLSITG